jgi:hypothetical protein
MLPNSFYHSTVQYEATLDKDADIVLRRLYREIMQTFEEYHGGYSASHNDWVVHMSTSHLHSLEIEESSIKFKMRVEYWGIGSQNEGVQQVLNVLITLPDTPFFSMLDTNTNEWTYYKSPEIENVRQLPIDAKFLFPYNHGDEGIDWTKPILLPISTQLNDQIIAFSLTSKGFPTQSSGSYARMMYFSAVTITTLGYGDIVPITTWARLIVALESVLGIVLIGLFLNSLARESRKN